MLSLTAVSDNWRLPSQRNGASRMRTMRRQPHVHVSVCVCACPGRLPALAAVARLIASLTSFCAVDLMTSDVMMDAECMLSVLDPIVCL